MPSTRGHALNNRYFVRSIVTAVSVVAAFASLRPCHAETGWLVVQAGDSCPMGPGTQVLMSSNAMKVSSPRGRIVMTTTGPDWKVYLVNLQARTYFQTNLADWLRTMQQEKRHGSLEGATWRRGNTTQIARMRAYEFVMQNPPSQGHRPITTTGTVLPPVNAARLWVAQDIATSATISNLFAKLYGIPDCQRLPLRLATASAGSQPSYRLDTLEAQQVPISASTFQQPAGFKPVKSYVDVITGSTDSSEFEELLK